MDGSSQSSETKIRAAASFFGLDRAAGVNLRGQGSDIFDVRLRNRCSTNDQRIPRHGGVTIEILHMQAHTRATRLRSLENLTPLHASWL